MLQGINLLTDEQKAVARKVITAFQMLLEVKDHISRQTMTAFSNDASFGTNNPYFAIEHHVSFDGDTPIYQLVIRIITNDEQQFIYDAQTFMTATA